MRERHRAPDRLLQDEGRKKGKKGKERKEKGREVFL
jgi:hypothetical protein